MYHLIVYTIKPDINVKLLPLNITYICDPVHLYCIASITEEASATSRDPVCQSSIQEEILTLRTEKNIGIYNLQVVATDTYPAPSTMSSWRASPWWSSTAGNTPRAGCSMCSAAASTSSATATWAPLQTTSWQSQAPARTDSA